MRKEIADQIKSCLKPERVAAKIEKRAKMVENAFVESKRRVVEVKL